MCGAHCDMPCPMAVGAPAKQDWSSLVVQTMASHPKTATSLRACGPRVTALPKYSGEPRRRREEHARGVPWLSGWHKTSVVSPQICDTLTPKNSRVGFHHFAGGFCVT